VEIIVSDKATGKQYMLAGHGLDWEIFRKSKGEKLKDQWVTARYYPSSLASGIEKIINLCLADPDDPTQSVLEAMKAASLVRKELRDRLNKIIAEVQVEEYGGNHEDQ